MFWHHFLQSLLRLVCVCGGSEFVGMVNTPDDEFLIHSYGENGVSFLEFFVPTIIGVGIGEDELFSHAVAATEDDRAAFPVYTQVVALEPVMPEVNILLPKVRDYQVNSFSVFANHH